MSVMNSWPPPALSPPSEEVGGVTDGFSANANIRELSPPHKYKTGMSGTCVSRRSGQIGQIISDRLIRGYIDSKRRL